MAFAFGAELSLELRTRLKIWMFICSSTLNIILWLYPISDSWHGLFYGAVQDDCLKELQYHQHHPRHHCHHPTLPKTVIYLWHHPLYSQCWCHRSLLLKAFQQIVCAEEEEIGRKKQICLIVSLVLKDTMLSDDQIRVMHRITPSSLIIGLWKI